MEELEHENTNVPTNQTPEPERRFYDFLGAMVRDAADKATASVNIPDYKEVKVGAQSVIDKSSC